MSQLTDFFSSIFTGSDGSKLLVTALTGGVAGALLNQGATLLLAWWRKPVLEIIFAANEPGCAVNTRAEQRDKEEKVIAKGNQRYLRIKLQNTGRSTAHGVIVSIQQITFYPTNTAQTTDFAEEVFDLSVALSQSSTPFDLGRGAYRFLDVFCTEQMDGGPPTSRFSLHRPAGRLALLFGGGKEAGSYEARVFASSNQSDSVSDSLKWHWDGTLTDLWIPGN